MLFGECDARLGGVFFFIVLDAASLAYINETADRGAGVGAAPLANINETADRGAGVGSVFFFKVRGAGTGSILDLLDV